VFEFMFPHFLNDLLSLSTPFLTPPANSTSFYQWIVVVIVTAGTTLPNTSTVSYDSQFLKPFSTTPQALPPPPPPHSVALHPVRLQPATRSTRVQQTQSSTVTAALNCPQINYPCFQYKTKSADFTV
jgi:hypothetical protein